MNLTQPNPPCFYREVCLSFCLAAWAASICTADQPSTTAVSRITTSWEYDNNVLEEAAGKTRGGSGAVSLFSRVRYRTGSAVTQLDFQAGYKGHHRLSDSDSLTAGDILVHRLALGTERRLPGGWIAAAGAELKSRSIYRKNSLNLLSEEGYTRGAGRLSVSRSLSGLGSLTLGYRYLFFDCETFHSFNYRSHSPRAGLSRRLGKYLAGALEYSFTRRRYRRLIAVPDGNGGMVQLNERQRDRLNQLDFTLNYSRGLVLNLVYSLQRNSSNNFGFSYWNNRVGIILGKRLPLEVFLNAYLFFEIRRYSDKTDQPILVEVITEENDNNGWVLKLSRPVVRALEASFTFSYYRNQSSIRNLNFNKSLLNLGLTHRF
ncbi:MAG: hypothetical protein JXQ83_06730 [Candidatus Glassbacteria bacterium]|nr:hypothetical protein [Candidatus Glassbacteria bacterium]